MFAPVMRKFAHLPNAADLDAWLRRRQGGVTLSQQGIGHRAGTPSWSWFFSFHRLPSVWRSHVLTFEAVLPLYLLFSPPIFLLQRILSSLLSLYLYKIEGSVM